MLESLTIRNYAIIDELSLELGPGLAAITGETGAGKSIVADALELVLGARASLDMIRSGEQRAEVTAVFAVPLGTLGDEEAGYVEDGLLILRRELRADGSSRGFVNDSPVTLKVLKALGDRLVDLHGQHDHQSLFNTAEHVAFLDGFGGTEALSAEVRELHAGVARVRDDIGKLERRIEDAVRDRELFRFQIGEIDAVRIQPDEDDELERDIGRLARASELKETGYRAFQRLSEDEPSVEDIIGSLVRDLDDLAGTDPELAPLAEQLGVICDGVGSIALELRRYADAVDDDPGLLAELEERLRSIERLKKKYGPTLEDVVAYRERIGRETESLDDVEDELAGLRKRLESMLATLGERAALLSARRRDSAPSLSRDVEAHLGELGLEGARLVIDIGAWDSGIEAAHDGSRFPVRRDGADRVEFLFSANPGEPPKPLARIASGGELSRVMLALKLALSETGGVPTMVFDEIDTGVSGRVAEAVGTKLQALAVRRQVVVITHLPQIAGKAAMHLSARKDVRDGRTVAGLVRLEGEDRERELASLLSGATVTDAALEHARQMISGRNDA